MMPPGHIAATWGIVTLLQQSSRKLGRLDYRLLAVAALLPDIIDKPLAIWVFPEAQTSQLITHSLLVHLPILLGGLLLWRKVIPYILAFNGHLVFDRMWNHTESFWWPLFGWDTFWAFTSMNSPETMVSVYLDILTRYPQVWVIELLALGLLVWYIYRYQLYKIRVLTKFFRRGRLE